MIVAATTACFPDATLSEAIDRLADAEFGSIEIALHEDLNQLKPSEVAANLSTAILKCNAKRRLNLIAFSIDIRAEGEAYFDQFDACCQLAKATKIVTLTVPSSPHGTPFNEEVERFKRLAKIAENHGVRVGMRSMYGHLSEDPDTVTVICDHVKGLALSFDPSQYVYQTDSPRDTERLMKYTHHVYLRDSNRDHLQTLVGQGVIEYGKIIAQLQRAGYHRALCVHIVPMPNAEHLGELRKIRLLLESLIE